MDNKSAALTRTYLEATPAERADGPARHQRRPPSPAPLGQQRLSRAHFAYLRAFVQGADQAAAARVYLGLDHGHQLRTLHAQVVAQLRALARRAGDHRWRLIGMDVGALTRLTETTAGSSNAGGNGAAGQRAQQPTLQEWVDANGYDDGWTQAEQLEMYREAYPPSAEPAAVAGQRKASREARMRARQLEVIASLERVAAVAAKPTDPVSAWLEPAITEKLTRAGFVMLGEVQRAARGKRWWRGMPGVGVAKATRIADYVDHLLPAAAAGAGADQVAAAGRTTIRFPA
ncbi:MAG TPA: phage integrase family protein, partial [Burkholderiaceae bacterium]|nr:phage integrase family protein [Burkholderiaceae bacterium]